MSLCKISVREVETMRPCRAIHCSLFICVVSIVSPLIFRGCLLREGDRTAAKTVNISAFDEVVLILPGF